MSKILVVIPARLKSQRLSDKLLRTVNNNQSVIQRCVEQTIKAVGMAFGSKARIVVAVDDYNTFAAHLQQFQGQIDVVRTSHHHINGTSRASEVIDMPEYTHQTHIILIQGDELFVHQDDLTNLLLMLIEHEAATIVRPEYDPAKAHSFDTVKVKYNRFVKEVISMGRDPIEDLDKGFWEHVGMYSYRPGVLRQSAGEHDSPIMLSRSIELLKFIEYGFNVGAFISMHGYLNVNTAEDLQKAQALLSRKEMAS